MKQLVIGDIHGKTLWKELVAQETFDKIIFVGNYVDSLEHTGAEQLHNLKEIIQYKKDNPDKVVLLIGNHDLHYILPEISKYSGYQSAMQPDFYKLFTDNKELFQAAYEPIPNVVVVHAGITQTWAENNGWDGEVNIVDFTNELWKYKPGQFHFTPGDHYNPYGDEICQTPVWVRNNSLLIDAIPGIIYIVGHTRHNELTKYNENLYVIDTLDVSKEYLIFDGEEIKTNTIKTKS